ncbi:ATP-grasp domain-containing protein [Kineosporia sp. NBRC 101731]|uniref:ATP-grasp domain-containing protein n=1 Tax=Kineosporia sp. NBRC 101731 TaxID=3032199 RepID=UPI0024A45470|nr:ATP-grasp domain-containing protein [Kineosporia sp. NBRC 101731]GLY30938.1 hypothetical protein Kisp02_43030 [Kineosporia sp. NBRC 101731]
MSDETPPTLLFVGGARAVAMSTDMALQALGQARARGIHTYVTNAQEALLATPAVVAAAGATAPVSFLPAGETVEWARNQVGSGHRIDAVFALQEMAQVTVAETAQALGAVGNPVEAVHRVRTKDIGRAALAAAGFAQPAVRLCADQADAEDFLRSGTGPWIVKPRDAMGSIGVSQVFDTAGLPAALDLLPGTAPFLVEEFVDGPEYSVEGIFLDGRPVILAVTEKEKVDPPYFVEIAHALPADLPPGRQEEIEHTVTAALRELGLRAGGFHVELWLTRDGVVLGEVHTRFGGDFIHTMLAHAIPGLELFGQVFDDLLGRRDRPGPLTPTRGAAVRYLAPPPGRIEAVHGWDEVREHPAVLYSELNAGPGDVVPALHRSADRIGLIVVGAETTAQAKQLAIKLTESIRFDIAADAHTE